MVKRVKTGGRSKGTPNVKTVEQKEYLAKLKEQYGCPIKGLLEIAENKDTPADLRSNNLKAVLPYFYAPRRAEDKDGNTSEPRLLLDPETTRALIGDAPE